MTERRIIALTAGLRAPSTSRMVADELGAAVVSELAALGDDVAVTVVELREHAHALVDALLTGFATDELAKVIEQVAGADGLIVVSPTMSAGLSGVFKMFFDVLERGQLAGMPVILAATGGTERHSLVVDHGLRPLFTHLRARPVPTGIFAATADFGGEGTPALQARMGQAARELAVEISGAPRATGPRDPLADGVDSFAQLLGR